MATRTFELLEGEKADRVEEAAAVLGKKGAKSWLDAENSQLGGMKPRELIESGNEAKQQLVRDLLRAIDRGRMS